MGALEEIGQACLRNGLKVEWQRDSFLTNCGNPSHPDKHPSFHFSRQGSRVLGYCPICQGGFDATDMLGSLGLPQEALHDDFWDGTAMRPVRKERPLDGYLQKFAAKKFGAGASYIEKYDYCDWDSGQYRFSRCRFRLKDGTKKLQPGIIRREMGGAIDIDGGFIDMRGGQVHREQIPKAIYCPNLKALRAAASEGKEIYFCEGEKDVNSLFAHGLLAFTCGSAQDWRKTGEATAPVAQGAQLVILADYDGAGRDLAMSVAKSCQPYAKSIKMLYPCTDEAGADVSDFFSRGTKEQLLEMVEQRGYYPSVTLEQPPTRDGMKPARGEKPVAQPQAIAGVGESAADQQEIRGLTEILRGLQVERTLEHSDKGHGALYARVFRGRHAYNITAKDWSFYDGIAWRPDPNGLQADRDAKLLAAALFNIGREVDATGDGFLKAIRPLANRPARMRMLEDAKSENGFHFREEELDVDPWILNCPNGTLLLDGDKPQFVEHDAGMMLSMVCGAAYDPEARSELWEQTVAEIMQGNEQKIRYLRQIAGLSLTGIMIKQSFFFHGETTNNGKSLICHVLRALLGSYAATLKAESLAVRQNIDGRAASPDIAAIRGKRLITIAEPRRGMILDVQLFNEICDGMDPIRARRLFQDEMEFLPVCKLVLHCNYLPRTLDDTSLFDSGRVHVLEFNRSFSEEERDRTLRDKLTTPNELSGILNWALEGLWDFKANGMQEPTEVRAATARYKESNDKLADFIAERLVETPGHNCKASDVYAEYVDWAKAGNYGVQGKKTFFDTLRQRKLFADVANVGGRTWRGVVLDHAISVSEEQQGGNAGDFVDAEMFQIPFE